LTAIWSGRVDRRLDVQAEHRQHIDTDEHKEDEQEHHHIDHRNDLDASLPPFWIWPGPYTPD
jgi:hypothetical protein